MKKAIAVGLICLLPVGVVLADNDVGCGAGTMIWEGHSGMFPKVFAATTNGTTSNQTFGISSGTLGCSRDGTVTAANVLPMFTGANMEELARNMAAGHGEALAAMARLYGIDNATDRHAFYRMTQTQFANIFSGDNVTAGQVIRNVDRLMRQNPHLAGYVNT